MNGISSSGRIRLTTPLFPCRPAILSPCRSFRLVAIRTFTVSSTPGGSSSLLLRFKRWMSMTVPSVPWGTFKEVSRTSLAFSPKIELSNLNSGVVSLSLFGVTFPTMIDPGRTMVPMRTIPSSSSCSSIFSLVFGISRVSFSGPSLVSRISVVNSLICTLVKMSSLTTRSLIRTASS